MIYCTQLNGFKYGEGFNSSIWPKNGTLTGQCEPGCNNNEWVLHTPQSSGTCASPFDGLVPFPEHLLELGSHTSAEMQLAYSTAFSTD